MINSDILDQRLNNYTASIHNIEQTSEENMLNLTTVSYLSYIGVVECKIKVYDSPCIICVGHATRHKKMRIFSASTFKP